MAAGSLLHLLFNGILRAGARQIADASQKAANSRPS